MIRIEPYTRTVNPDLLARRINPRAELSDQLAVDLDPTVENDLLAFASRSESRLGKNLLQANTFLIVFMRFERSRICVWHRSPNVAGQLETVMDTYISSFAKFSLAYKPQNNNIVPQSQGHHAVLVE